MIGTIADVIAVHYVEYDSTSQDDSWKCHCQRWTNYRTRREAEMHVAEKINDAIHGRVMSRLGDLLVEAVAEARAMPTPTTPNRAEGFFPSSVRENLAAMLSGEPLEDTMYSGNRCTKCGAPMSMTSDECSKCGDLK